MTVIQHKRGTSDNWATQNPTLAAGEIGYELDTGKFKIGNGSSDWLSLSYFSTDGSTTVISGGGTGSGTVTSVDITLPTGLVVSGNPITTSGTLAIAYDSGYSIPTDMSQGYWSTAYGWGDHSLAGYLLSSTASTTYQPLDGDLTAIAALSADGLLRKTSGTWGMDTATYLTSYTETDTLASVTGRGATTNTAISITNNTSSTTTTTGALKVTGGVGIQENLNVGGNLTLTGDLTVNGTTTTLNSTIVTVDDPIFVLGGDTAPGSDDNKDRGIAFRWHNGATAKIGFFGFDDSAQQFTFIPDATITNEVISGSTGTISANLNGNATSADTLSTARNLWGQSFDGSGDITGSLTSVSDITSSDTTFSIGTTSVTTISGNTIAITGGTTSNTVGTGGSISLTAGSATSSTGANFGGNINIAAGASTVSTSGTGGNVSILAGNGQTKGTISIGTSNTSAITIGASGITTTVAGTLSASLNALTISSPLSGTSYNGSSAVTLALSNNYGDTQNPYAAKAIKTFLAGPAGGVSGSPTFRVIETTDIPDLSGTYVTLSGNQSISGTKTFTTNPAIQIAGNSGLSIGRTDGTASVNYIDFNNGATVVDYDARIYSSGGTGTTGQGDFAFYAASSTFNGNLLSTGTVSANGGTINSTASTLSIVPTSITTVTGRNLSLAGGASTSTGIGNGGDISITGGAATSATTASTGGTITITGGASNSTVGVGGDIVINAGVGSSGNNGVITIGGTNTKSLTIGAAGITTTVLGTLSASFSTLTISSPLSGTSYNGSSNVSIGLSSGYGDTQNPYAAKAIKTFLAGPAGGVSGSPTFRVIETTDIPDLSGTYLTTSGTASNSTNINISTTNGNTSDTTMYPVLVGANTTGAQAPHTDISGFTYDASANTIATGNISLTGTVSANGGTINSTASTLSIAPLSTGGTAGRAVSITGGASTSTSLSSGGSVTIVGGATTTGTNASTGGAITITAGAGNSTAGIGGSVTINAGAGSVANGNGTISIGTANTDSVTIGASGKTTTVGGTLTADQVYSTNNGNGTNFKVGDDAWIGDVNLANTIRIKGQQNSNNAYVIFGDSDAKTLGRAGTGRLLYDSGLVVAPYMKMISTDNATLINVSPGVPTTYSAFGTDGISLAAGAYEVEMLLNLTATTASNSCTLVVTPGSPTTPATPSSSQLYYDYSDSTTVITNAAATSAVLRTGTTTFPALNTITIATGATRYLKAFMKGIVRISTAGNFTIRLAFTPTSPGTVTGTIYAGSYLKITPLGIEGVTDVGTWT